MKKMYEFDPETKEFMGVSLATENPKNPGEYLARVNASFDAPPEAGENEKAVWNGEAWEITPDYRGTRYFFRNLEGKVEVTTIIRLGQVVPSDGYIDIVDVPKTPEEREVEMRGIRNIKLHEADVLINKAEDVGEDTTALRQYRQKLRDVPEQPGFPEKIIWPEVIA